MNKAVSARVFIVGCPRSGTTLLQSMLAGHPRIKSFPETHFFSWAFPRNRLKRALTWPALNVQGLLERFVQELGREDLCELARVSVWQRAYQRPFIQVLDHLTLDDDKDVWVEKTPRHLYFVGEIQRRVPGAKFIHIIRNGPDVVASLYQATNDHPELWHGRRTIDQCIDRWNRDVALSAGWLGDRDHFLVRYEFLLADNKQVSYDLCSFLRIEYDEAMSGHNQAYDQIVRPTEIWKANVAKPLKSGGGKFERLFTPEQQQYIQDRLLDAANLIGRFDFE